MLTLSEGVAATLVYDACLQLDSTSWPPGHPTQVQAHPMGSTSPVRVHLSPLTYYHASVLLSPSLDDLSQEPSHPIQSQTFLDSCQQLRHWLRQLPVHLLDMVVVKVISIIEEVVVQDKDHRLIMTIINIDRCKPSDLSFGIHALFTALADTGISQLQISNKLWFCVSEFEDIGSSKLMNRTIIDSIPRYQNLNKINLAYVATDKFLFLLAQHCNLLEELSLDHSSVTDRGIRFLSGWSGGVRRALFNDHHRSEPEGSEVEGLPASFPKSGPGCPKLRYLSLDSCTSVTDQALWYLLQHNAHLQVLIYNHQTYSIAEILCNEFSKSSNEIKQFRIQKMALTVLDHPFPYGLNVQSEVVEKIAFHCPYITTVNLVSNDAGLSSFIQMRMLRRATIELEDCFGMGLNQFLSSPIGQNLMELTLSCSSDPDATLLDVPGGGQAHQLFNIGLKIARRNCPNLVKLSLFGCGLVSNQLINLLDDDSIPDVAGLRKLKSLILLTYYEDDNPVQTCEEKLLLKILKECRELECLSLEGNFANFLGDRFFSNLLNANPMNQLKILDIRGTKVPLTISSLKRCLTLERIQELRVSAWSVSDPEFEEVATEVKQKGWDLSLTRKKQGAAAEVD